MDGSEAGDPADELFWKKKHESLVDQIRNVEERMKHVVFKLKSESIEKRREAEIWKMRFINLRKEMEEMEGAPREWDDSYISGSDTSETHEAFSPSRSRYAANRELVPTMTTGSSFRLFTSTTREMIVLQFVENPLTSNPRKLDGVFAWTSVGGRTKGRLALGSITDIYLGKQTGVFNESLAQSTNADLCVSLVGGDDELNLEATSAPILAAWLKGVFALLELHGKKAALQEGGHYVVLDLEEYERRHPQLTDVATPEGAVAMMKRGQIFGCFTEDGTSELMMVTFDPALGPYGGLRCSSPQGQKPGLTMPLHLVSEIRLGKQSQAFRYADKLPDDKCFSLFSSEMNAAINLYSEAENQIINWLYGINSVITEVGTAVKLETNSVASSMRDALEDDDPDFNGPYRTVTEGSAVLTMCNGADFVSYSFPTARDASPTAALTFLFYHPTQGKFGTLYWCRPGTREELPNQSLPLHTLTDIYGESATFKRLSLTPAQRACCFSLIGRRVSLHLRAQTRQQAQQWLSGVRQVLSESGQVVAPTTGRPQRREEPLDTRPPTKPNPEPTSPTGVAALSVIQEGRIFNLHDQSPSSPHRILLRYSPGDTFGRLWWTIDKQPFSLDVGAITKILHGRFRGCQVSPEVADRVVLRLVTPIESQSLHLAADSEQDLLAFARGLQDILTQGGAQCFNLKVNPVAGKEHSPSLPTCVTVLTSPLGGEVGSTQWLRAGVPFLWCGSATQQELVRLMFVDSRGSPGFIFWRTSQSKHSIALRDVVDMIVGRTAHEFEGAGDGSCSLSIIAKNDRFDGIAPSPQALQAWINALSRVLSSVLHPSGEEDPQQRLVKGASFTRHSLGAAPEPLTLFIEPSGEGFGLLCWCEPGQRVKTEECSVRLDSVLDVSAGRSHPAFQAAALSPELCLSIVTSSTELHLSAASEQTVQDWLHGLNRLRTSNVKAGE